jgi:hypothetical protein
MRDVPKEQIRQRIRLENPWWNAPHTIAADYGAMVPRAYLDLFLPLVRQTSPRRAVVLMGPRRVGKTVLLHHTIENLLRDGVPPRRIVYLSVENPLYNGLALEELFGLVREESGDEDAGGFFVFFDEIQYLRGWEQHLKSLVDTYRTTKWIASGSAAAALRLKSNESGAGRFTDFVLPPLTFHEYLMLLGRSGLVRQEAGRNSSWFVCSGEELESLNANFVDYLNFGGYPEVVVSPEPRADPARYVRADIIDKVLLRDLPSLYGIQDVQELNALFTTLAFNTANEVSLEALSKKSGVAKNTLKRYIEYLEAAFLIRRVDRVDRDGRRFQRATAFKVYLTNPSLRAALFAPVDGDDEAQMGDLVETALFAQWFHSRDHERLYYARWREGEVDLVYRLEHEIGWATEAKWTDRFFAHPTELTGLLSFCREHGLGQALVTTRRMQGSADVDGVRLDFRPASLYCYTVGYNVVKGLKARMEQPEFLGPEKLPG